MKLVEKERNLERRGEFVAAESASPRNFCGRGGFDFAGVVRATSREKRVLSN